MSIIASHYIDPDGDVDLLLPYSEGTLSPLDGALTLVAPAPGLNCRRSTTRANEERYVEAQPVIGEELEEAPYEEAQEYEEIQPAESQLEAIEESSGSDGVSEPQQNPELESPATRGQPGNISQERAVNKQHHSPITDEKYVRMRTSSKHLVLASPYFRRNLQSGMSESQALHSQGHVQFSMAEQDPEAMLIVMNIIHGRSRNVPRLVDLDMLTKLAVIVDYLECLEVVEPFSDRWVDNLKGDIPKTYSSELIKWLCVSFVFRKEIQFETITSTAIRLSRCAIETLGLPIPGSLLENIELRRYGVLDRLLSALEELLEDFRHDRVNCTFECNAMQYGVLAKELSLRGLHSPRPQIPFFGYSIEDFITSIRGIRDPEWCVGNTRSYYSSYCEYHGCNLTSRIAPVIRSVENDSKGLILEEFCNGTTGAESWIKV